MIYYSHSKKTENRTVEGSKLLKVHINGVLKKALLSSNNGATFGFDEREFRDIITLIVKLHDLGKYTSFFQSYLLQKNPIDYLLKRHAQIGGIVAYNFFKDKDIKIAIMALYLIFSHHSKLTDIEEIPGKFNDHLKNIFLRQKADIQKILSLIEEEIELDNLSEYLKYPDEKALRKAIKIWSKREADIRYYFLFNYIFSLLIEADKLDASDTELYSRISIPSDLVDKRFGSGVASDSSDLCKMSNNDLRNYCRAAVVSNLDREDILDHHLFTLTAPTGTGKTMTVLDFALKLKEKIRRNAGNEAPIIYALPFINIIEQALREYEQETFKGRAKILAHYQFADVFGGQDEDDDEQNYNQKLMSLDTWQSDIVITSFVQFFETLIGNKNKLLKKFNHFAGAIIIIDEVQTLRLDQMPLIGAALFFLAKYLKSRIILMTATKPKIFELAQKEILDKEGETVRPVELLENYHQVFALFNRTRIIPLLDAELDKENLSEDFVKKVFSKKWNPGKSCLIVCNTVKRSIQFYQQISSFLKDNKLGNPLFYLSTNVVPTHRFDRIEKIKRAIEQEEAPILISTQVVEAGVDLDFDMGFRDVGPVDSIIQVAGRINRNNNINKKNAPLFIIDLQDARKIYGIITYEQSKKALGQKSMFYEKEYLELINTYFDSITDRSSFSEYSKIFASLKCLKYDSENKEERPVSSFKIIEESQNTTSIFIELGEEEQKLRSKYFEKITGKISKEEFDRKYKRVFNQRIIAVPTYLASGLEFINEYEDKIHIVPKEQLSSAYNIDTGFIRELEKGVTTFL